MSEDPTSDAAASAEEEDVNFGLDNHASDASEDDEGDAALKEWKAAEEARVAKFDASEKEAKAELKAAAKETLASMKAARHSTLEANYAANRADEVSMLAKLESDMDSENTWERVASLAGVFDETDPDAERASMRAMFMQLKADPPRA